MNHAGLDKIIVCKIMDYGDLPVETEVWDAADWALDASKSPHAYAHETAEVINLSFGFDTRQIYFPRGCFREGKKAPWKVLRGSRDNRTKGFTGCPVILNDLIINNIPENLHILMFRCL